MCLGKNSSSRRLELEVTERLLLEDNDGTLAAMEQLKNLGVGISLDDFGTGYSSLNYLRKFPFQEIKIDQSFIAGLGEERDAQAIIGAVAGLGARLDKVVVAEGIETEEQMKQVRTHGCHGTGSPVRRANDRGRRPDAAGGLHNSCSWLDSRPPSGGFSFMKARCGPATAARRPT